LAILNPYKPNLQLLRVILQRWTMRELTRETMVALEGWGGKRVRASQGHQALIAEDPATVSQVGRFKTLKALNTAGVAMARGHGIEAGAAVLVAGNRRDAKQGVGVMAALVVLEPALVRQKRGRLGTEEAQGASGSIGHTGWCLAAGTTVGQWLDPLLEHSPEIIAASGVGHRDLLGARG